MKARATLLLGLFALGAPAQQRGIVVADKSPSGTISAQVEGRNYVFGTYHALMISIERYQRPFSELKTPHEDVSRIKRVLKEHYGFSQFTILQDQQATRSGILQAIGAYRGILGEQDNLLIYFAGHGLKQDFGKNEESSDYYWVPYDGTRDFTSWVSAAVVRSLVRNVRARHVVLISDSCFSGGLLRSGGLQTRSAPKSIISQHQKASSQVFTSGGLEPVEDSGREGCSLFAYHVAKRLEANQSSYLTLRGLAHAVTGDVAGAMESRQVPEFGPIRGARHEYGDFVFFRTARPGEVNARPAVALQEGVPAGWILPPGVVRTEEGRFFSKVQGRDEAEMVLVSGARYRAPGSDETIVVEPFLIDKFEVTNERFRRFAAAHPEILRELGSMNREGFDDPAQPVVDVSLATARKFADWAGKALPTEVQWHYAAGYEVEARRHRRYPWGDEFGAGGFRRMGHPPRVAAFPADRSPNGVHDMGGGVRELCELAHRDVERGVVRGGTQYLMIRLDRLDSDLAYRSPCGAKDRLANVGFRCILHLRRP